MSTVENRMNMNEENIPASSANGSLPSVDGGRGVVASGFDENEYLNGQATAEILAEIGATQTDSFNIEEEGEHAKRKSVAWMLGLRVDACLGALNEATDQQASTPQFIENDRMIALKTKILGGGIFGAGCIAACAINGAVMAEDVTQSLPQAIIAAFPLPAFSVALEAFAGKLTRKQERLERVMGYLCVGSAVGFLGTFSQTFAYLPGLSEFAEEFGGMDRRALFATQCALEITSTFGIVAKLREWIGKLEEPRINPKWRKLEEEIERLDESLQLYQGELNEVEGESKAYEEKKARIQARQRKLYRFLQS